MSNTTIQSMDTKTRVRSMLKLDFYRLFNTPLFYIMIAIAAIIPAMVLALSSVDMTAPPSATNSQYAANAPQIEMPKFDYTFMMIESSEAFTKTEDPNDILNLAGFANINMLYIFAGLLMAIFVAHDYSSGFVKSIFTVHSKKVDYVISKSAIGLFSGVCMIGTYLVGTILAGMLTGKSFEVDLIGLIACLISKALLMGIFCGLFLGIAVFFKNKLWMTIVFTFLLGMMFYPAASFVNIDSSPVVVFAALAAGIAGLFGFGLISTAFLKRRDLA